MKRTKKILALVLAMMMAFSLMAMPAMAYEEGEHVHTEACSDVARIPAMQCYNCGRGMAYYIGEGYFYCSRCDIRVG